MPDHLLSASILAFFFFLPAILCLVFVCLGWFANKKPSIKEWRISTFRWGLILAPLATVLLFTSAVHLLLKPKPAQGPWLLFNYLAIALWALCLAAAFTGKSWGRALLISWGILVCVGVLGADLAIIP
jgi:hypothetical protein